MDFVSFRKYSLDDRKYYGQENHIPQKEFLRRLHNNKGVHKKISETRKKQFRLGLTINGMLGKHHSKITKQNHSKLMKSKYELGILIPHNKGKTAENYEPLKRMGLKTLGENNSSKRPEVRAKMSRTAKLKYSLNPECHPNRSMNCVISNPQKQLFFLIKKIYKEAQLNYPVKCKNSVRYLDVAVPSSKIDYEYDEPRWHNQQEDRVRDKELKNVGWKTKRIKPNDLKEMRIKMGITKQEIAMQGIKYVI